MKTTTMLSREDALANRKWFVIDAQNQVLGRVATQAATLLRGKRKPSFTPHVDCGDFVVVINAREVALTGAKEENKLYYRHSGYPGGIRSRSAKELREKFPERILRAAVTGMLPKNRLGRQLSMKLKVYAGPDHPHAAQQPVAVSVGAHS